MPLTTQPRITRIRVTTKIVWGKSDQRINGNPNLNPASGSRARIIVLIGPFLDSPSQKFGPSKLGHSNSSKLLPTLSPFFVSILHETIPTRPDHLQMHRSTICARSQGPEILEHYMDSKHRFWSIGIVEHALLVWFRNSESPV